ncbi:hypothetical protein GCM10023085_24850 [Actinomadura viridis]
MNPTNPPLHRFHPTLRGREHNETCTPVQTGWSAATGSMSTLPAMESTTTAVTSTASSRSRMSAMTLRHQPALHGGKLLAEPGDLPAQAGCFLAAGGLPCVDPGQELTHAPPRGPGSRNLGPAP